MRNIAGVKGVGLPGSSRKLGKSGHVLLACDVPRAGTKIKYYYSKVLLSNNLHSLPTS